MRAFSSLSNRIFIACTVVAALSLAFAFSFVNVRASNEAEEELQRGLAEAGQLVDEHRATLTDTFLRLARLIADLPKLKAAVETQDPPTVQPLADDYAAQMRADVLLLTSRDGAVLGRVGAHADTLAATARAVEEGREISTVIAQDDGLLQVVSVPLVLDGDLPVTLGRLTAGFRFNSALAAQFKGLTGSEIAFVDGGRVLVSTIPEARLQGGEDFMTLTRPLTADGGPNGPAVQLLRSRTERLRFLTTIRTGLLAALAMTVIAATLVSYGVARTMTRPLGAITSAMRTTAATGDLSHRVSLKSRPWDDEDARLLASTFNTMTDSIARFQREAAQKERLSSLGRLSTVIAHEIRNPLMIINSALPSLRRDDASPEERREAIADIDEETARLNRIVTEVLDFARPIRFDLADADVNDICRASAGAVSPQIRVDCDDSLPVVRTDAERLRTALVNLLTNARDAAEAAPGGDGAVALSTRRAGNNTVVVAIQDRGVGITPDVMAHIFDPFFTTRRAGTGLGLPIARNIIEGLGGTIAIASQPGHGTEIRIALPIESSGAAA